MQARDSIDPLKDSEALLVLLLEVAKLLGKKRMALSPEDWTETDRAWYGPTGSDWKSR